MAALQHDVLFEKANPLKGGDAKSRSPSGLAGLPKTKGINDMQIANRTKLMFSVVAVVAAMGVAGTAFTGTGVTSTAASTQFVGGTVTQGITGATLAGIAYPFGDAPANTAIRTAVLTFGADADGKTVGVEFTGGNAVAFTCTAVEVTLHTSTCTTAGADRTGATSIAITVS